MELVNNIEASFTELLGKYVAQHYYVAVSGGCDSMVMLSLFQKRLRSFTVLHVNYKLRGAESDEDEDFVRLFCTSNSIPFEVLRYELSNDLKDGVNLQNRAREIRYDFFKTYLSKHESAILCLAHHKNDQEENFWMAMARGGGLRAMAGMKAFETPYLRPLLDHTKADLITYAKEKKINWREDLSNQQNKFTRNIWRNVLLPQLKLKIPQISESVELLQKHFKKQVRYDRVVSSSLIPRTLDDFEISTNDLSSMNSNQWIEFLDQINIGKNLALSILGLLKSENGKKIHLNSKSSNYAFIWKRKNSLYFESKKHPAIHPPIFKVITTSLLPNKFNKAVLYLDPKKIKGNLSVRRWKNGDRMRPIGLKGSKLVADILKDDKTYGSTKKNQWVLVDEEKIISLIGFRIDQRVIAQKCPCLKVVFE